MSLKSAVSHVERMRSFLETDDPISWGTYPKKKEPINGLSLPTHVLDKIYYQNFTRIIGKEPSQLNVTVAISECRRMAKIIKKIGRTESSKFNLGWEATEKQSSIEQIINMLKNLIE